MRTFLSRQYLHELLKATIKHFTPEHFWKGWLDVKVLKLNPTWDRNHDFPVILPFEGLMVRRKSLFPLWRLEHKVWTIVSHIAHSFDFWFKDNECKLSTRVSSKAISMRHCVYHLQTAWRVREKKRSQK